MQLITIEKSQTTKLVWLLVGFFAFAVVMTIEQDDPLLVAAACLLALVAMMPFYCWLLGWSHGLPIWPVFALFTGLTSALPVVQDPAVLSEYTANEIINAVLTTAGFILLGTFVWLSSSSRAPKAPRKIIMIEQSHAVRYLLLFVAAGLLFSLNQYTGWIRFPGNTMQVVRGITGALSLMGLFVLGYYHGKGLLDKRTKMMFVGGAIATALANMTSLMLASALMQAAMPIFGYALGSNRVPLRAVIIVFFITSLLHAGKYEMRERYWSEGATRTPSLHELPFFYSEWLGAGLRELGGLAGLMSAARQEEKQSTIFERAGMVHMLLLVQKKTPSEVPFFNGLTYAHIPRLLVPRFIDPEKGISHTGNILLSVNYGLLTLEGANTSIGWGLLAESYANFGYVGVGLLAVALGLFYGWAGRLTSGVPMTSLRFVIGLMIMAAATTADTMGIFVSMQFQGIVGVSFAAIVLMRRQANPFATGEEHTIPQLEGRVVGGVAGGRRAAGAAVVRKDGVSAGENGIREKANGIRHTANGIRQEAEGVPAPGVLVGLIEGAQPEGGGGHTADGMRQTADGGTVRTMPIRTPKRIASWMPRRVRAAVVAQQQTAAEETGDSEQEAGEVQTANGKRQTASERPRQLAVPYRNYRRYRGA